jgi:hypothetical protein
MYAKFSWCFHMILMQSIVQESYWYDTKFMSNKILYEHNTNETW